MLDPPTPPAETQDSGVGGSMAKPPQYCLDDNDWFFQVVNILISLPVQWGESQIYNCRLGIQLTVTVFTEFSLMGQMP